MLIAEAYWDQEFSDLEAPLLFAQISDEFASSIGCPVKIPISYNTPNHLSQNM
jgi:hypothetical protein